MSSIIYNTVKEYPDMFKIIIYHQPFIAHGAPDTTKVSDREPEVHYSSVVRTKQTIKDLCYCNKFTHFCTFTFDRTKVDRYSLVDCCYKMRTFFRSARWNHSPDLKYLVIPERHKDGAIHFHALVSGYKGKYKDSKRKTPSGLTIYNLTGWRYGYSTCTEIQNPEATMNYVTKYITKDMIIIPGERRYFSSTNLIRPIKTQNWLMRELKDKIKEHSPIYVTDEYSIFNISKNVDTPNNV